MVVVVAVLVVLEPEKEIADWNARLLGCCTSRTVLTMVATVVEKNRIVCVRVCVLSRLIK